MSKHLVVSAVVALHVLAAPAAMAERPGANRPPREKGAALQIMFGGLICHVFDGTHAPRAVILRGSESMPHRAVLSMPSSQILRSEVPLDCANGSCSLDLENTALRFSEPGEATFEPGGSFDSIVPHLLSVTGGAMAELRDEVFDEVPRAGGPVAAYLELPGGSLSAQPFTQLAAFDPDLEGRGERQFPNGVFLTGTLTQPALLVRRPGDSKWLTIAFRTGRLVELRISNEPVDGQADPMHAMLYYALSKVPLTAPPMIAMSKTSGIVALGTVPGCSNSAWP